MGRLKSRVLLNFGISVFLFTVVIITVEAISGFYLKKINYQVSLLKYQQVTLPLFKLNPIERKYEPLDERLVNRSFPQLSTKLRKDYRLFILGGSAAAGLGMSENASFARALERRLNLANRSEAKWHVINLGITAFSSKQVLLVQQEITRLLLDNNDLNEKDLFVFYSGNNEFLSEHYKKIMRLNIYNHLLLTLKETLIQHSNTYSLIESFISEKIDSKHWQTINNLENNFSKQELVNKIRLNSQEINTIITQYTKNISQAAKNIKIAGATPIIMTVATNLEWEGNISKEGYLKSIVKTPLRLQQLQKEIHTTKTGPYEKWQMILELAYLKRILEPSSNYQKDFYLAKDLDPNLRRSTSSMNKTLSKISKANNIFLIDTENALNEMSAQKMSGFDFFYDYVHTNLLGAESIAEAIDNSLVKKGYIESLQNKKYKEKLVNSVIKNQHDSLYLNSWIGWNYDISFIDDIDLWKYQRMLITLQKKIMENSADSNEIIWLANAYALEINSKDKAINLYNRLKKNEKYQKIIDHNLTILDNL